MKTDTNLEFINKCITDAGQALIYREYDDRTRQALGIKTILEVDQQGQLYFSMHTQFEEKFSEDFFPVEILVYKKDMPYYISAKGMAERILSNPEMNICVRMNDVEIVKREHKKKGLKDWWLDTARYMGLL
jgi:hypothetical protein